MNVVPALSVTSPVVILNYSKLCYSKHVSCPLCQNSELSRTSCSLSCTCFKLSMRVPWGLRHVPQVQVVGDHSVVSNQGIRLKQQERHIYIASLFSVIVCMELSQKGQTISNSMSWEYSPGLQLGQWMWCAGWAAARSRPTGSDSPGWSRGSRQDITKEDRDFMLDPLLQIIRASLKKNF